MNQPADVDPLVAERRTWGPNDLQIVEDGPQDQPAVDEATLDGEDQ